MTSYTLTKHSQADFYDDKGRTSKTAMPVEPPQPGAVPVAQCADGKSVFITWAVTVYSGKPEPTHSPSSPMPPS